MQGKARMDAEGDSVLKERRKAKDRERRKRQQVGWSLLVLSSAIPELLAQTGSSAETEASFEASVEFQYGPRDFARAARLLKRHGWGAASTAKHLVQITTMAAQALGQLEKVDVEGLASCLAASLSQHFAPVQQ